MEPWQHSFITRTRFSPGALGLHSRFAAREFLENIGVFFPPICDTKYLGPNGRSIALRRLGRAIERITGVWPYPDVPKARPQKANKRAPYRRKPHDDQSMFDCWGNGMGVERPDGRFCGCANHAFIHHLPPDIEAIVELEGRKLDEQEFFVPWIRDAEAQILRSKPRA